MKPKPPQKAEPPRDVESDIERFRVHDKAAIQRIFSDLARHHERTTIFFKPGENFLLSAVIDYDPAAETLYLDCGTNEAANQGLLLAEKLLAVASHRQVPVRFNLSQPEIVTYQGHRAFAISQPETLLRIQRRQFFRVATPVAKPLLCRFSIADGAKHEALLIDISLGGMALREHRAIPEGTLYVGRQIPTCRIELPNHGVIDTGFTVRNVCPSSTRPGTHQIGCEFTHLSSRTRANLQRYIVKLDLDHRRVPEHD